MTKGLYLTSADFPQFQDEMSTMIEGYEDVMGIEQEKTYLSTGDQDARIKNITFVVTESCNLNCSYCYEKHKTAKTMTREIAKDGIECILNPKLINGYYDSNHAQGIILEFIGGEPLLNIDVIDYTVEYFKKRTLELNHPWAMNYMISISTNGVLYETEDVQSFLCRNKGRVSVGITIDGNKELHDSCRKFHDGTGSYDIVESSVKRWLQNDVNAQTKITLSPQNVMFLNDAMENMINLGMKCAFTNCVFEEGWELDHAKILYREMIKLADFLLSDENYNKFYCSLFDEIIGEKLIEKRNWCGGNGSMLAIGTDGKLFPCIRFMQYSLDSNVSEQSIGDIWSGINSEEDNNFLKCLKCVDMETQCQHEDNKKCLNCEVGSGCALCTGYNYDYYGDPDHKATFICDMHRARVLANVYYWNKLYKRLNIKKKFNNNLSKKMALTILSNDECGLLDSLTGDH